MKRTYIKPFMESEEFVTNEYVAACYKVTCENDESMIVTKQPIFDAPDGSEGDADGFAKTLYGLSVVDAYYGEIDGVQGEHKMLGFDGQWHNFHIIKSVETRNGNGPNAS